MTDKELRSAYENEHYDKATMEILIRLDRVENTLKLLAEDKAKYVSREEFKPIQAIVYGLVTTVLLSFIGALVALVIAK